MIMPLSSQYRLKLRLCVASSQSNDLLTIKTGGDYAKGRLEVPAFYHYIL